MRTSITPSPTAVSTCTLRTEGGEVLVVNPNTGATETVRYPWDAYALLRAMRALRRKENP